MISFWGFRGTNKDITNEKVTEKKLKEKTEEQNILLTLFDKGDSVLVKWNNNKDYSIEYVSSNIINLLGYTKEEFMSGNILYDNCIYKEDLPRVNKELEIAKNSNNDFIKHGSYRVVTKDNELKWVNDETVIIRDKYKNILYYVGYLLDVTKEKEAESLRVEQDRLITEHSKLASMGEMIGNIAHQWRQPLSGISIAASGIQIEKSAGILDYNSLDEKLEMIVKQTKYLSETIDTFREYAKESKVKKAILIADEVKRAKLIVETTLKSAHINLIDNIDTNDKTKIFVSSGELSEVLINIFNNAKDVFVENKKEKPTITISMKKEDFKVILMIEDNGGGIDENILPRIFEPYFTTKHKSQGTGLGLHMCYKIITEELSGKIYVKNGESGAIFYIELPIYN